MATSNNTVSTSTVSTVNSITTTINTMNAITMSAVSASIVCVLSAALRPATTTRASIKAASRTAMGRASRKANRPTKAHHTQSTTTRTSVASRTNRLARIARRTARTTSRLFAIALMGVVIAPKAKAVTVTAVMEAPKLKIKPLADAAMARPACPVRTTKAAQAEVEDASVVAAIDKAVKVESLAEKVAARTKKVEAKAAATALQAANIVAKATAKASKRTKAATTSTPKASKAKGKKAAVTSQRNEVAVIAGPTNGNDYGWTAMSDMEVASFFYSEEEVIAMGLDEVTTPMTPAPIQRGDHDLYNLVLNMASMKDLLAANAAKYANTTNEAAKPPTNVFVMNVGGTRVRPAVQLTELLYALPEGWFSNETSRINYSGMTAKQTHNFVGLGGTISIMLNNTVEGSKYAGTLFVKNSHPRLFTQIKDTKAGTEYVVFSSWLEIILNASNEESNKEAIEDMEAFMTVMEEHRDNIEEDMASGAVSNVEEYFAAMNIEYEVPTKPVHYIVMVMIMVRDANGKAVIVDGKAAYDYDINTLNTEKQAWEAKGYQVIGINGALALPNLGVENFRLNGCIPCTPVHGGDIIDMNIKEWTGENYHRAVKPVTDLSDWFQTLMATGTVKSLSISFNNITFPDEIESSYKGAETIVHQYSFTTGKEQYDDAGVDSSIPAFTINLWTTAVVIEGAVNQKVADEAASKATVYSPKGKGVGPSTSIEQQLKLNQTHSRNGLFARRQDEQQAAKEASAKLGRPRNPVGMTNTNIVNGAETLNQVTTFPTTTVEVRAAVEFTTAVEVYPASTEGAVTERVAIEQATVNVLPTFPTALVGNVASKGFAALEATNAIANVSGKASNEDNLPSDEEDDRLNEVADLFDLCQQVALSDIAMPKGYPLALEAMLMNLGFTIVDQTASWPTFGMITGMEISINEALSANHRAQVLLHEAFHYICDCIGADNANAIITDWSEKVAPSTYTPADSSDEEQTAYSFMGYAHDLNVLSGLLTSASACAMACIENHEYDNNIWIQYYNALETAVSGIGKVMPGSAPIAIVKNDHVAVAVNHVADALSKIQSRHLLVMCASSGNIPGMYKQAMPSLVVPAMEIGECYTTDINGVTVHAICAANEDSTVVYGPRLQWALRSLNVEQGSKTTYICEQDLGFGDNIGTTSSILGRINNTFGKRAKVISMHSMKTTATHLGQGGNKPMYAKADLSLFSSGMTIGTALMAVPVGSTPEVTDGNYYGIGDSAMVITLAILDGDDKVDQDALQTGLVELENAIDSGISQPIYVYSCQQEAFTNVSCGVKVVDYAAGAFLSEVKVGVLEQSPQKGRDLRDWYTLLVHELNGSGGKNDGLVDVMQFSAQLYTDAFSVMGIRTDLAPFALCPVPLTWLQHGIVLVIPGKGANGLIEKAVSYEELIDKGLYLALLGLGVRIYTAEWVYDKAAKSRVLKGKSTAIYGEVGSISLPNGEEGESMLVLKDHEQEFVNGNVIGTDVSHNAVKSLAQYMQKHLLDTVQYLVDTKGVGVAIAYMEAVLPEFVKKVDEARVGKVRYHLGVYNKAKVAEYYMEFTENEGKGESDWNYLSPKHCDIHSSSKDLEVNKITNLSGFPDTLYDGVTVAIGLAISAGSGREMTQDVFEGYLASTTNLWARADNYGLKLVTESAPAGYTISDALRVIIDNSGKTISATANQNITSKGVALGREQGARWPYHMPCNASLDLSVMESLMKKGELVLCDKYAMDRIIIGDGARAMLACVLTPEQAEKLKGYDENFSLEMVLNPINGNVVYTVCWPTDKASKALNRPSQFWGATQADMWKEALTWSALTTDLGNDKRSGVRGFKVQIIAAVTDFLSQGSGAASMFSKEARHITYSVPGTMRGTIDWTQVPTVQQKLNKDGKHMPGLAKVFGGPLQGEGPEGKDRDGKTVPALKWFCGTFAEKLVKKAIEDAMYLADRSYRVYEPGEEIVVLFDKLMKDGKEIEGFYPNGTTPGLPSSKLVLFSNDLGKQKVVVTGYRFQSLDNGERLQVILTYATVSDSMADNWSGAKLRGLGIKAILSYDNTIKYIGSSPLNGVDTDLNNLYRNGAIHFTSEGLKGNYAFMQGFAAAHGSAHMSGPYLIIDQYLMNGTENEYYTEGSADMISDMTDTHSYFYQWVRNNTRTIRMQKTLSRDIWDSIVLCNADENDVTTMPGLVIINEDDTAAVAWDSADGEHEVTITPSITVEYDVQVLVFDYWVQIEVADPGACTGTQGATGEQVANLAVVAKRTATDLWNQGSKERDGVRLAVESARIHAMIEMGHNVDGVFTYDPMNESHRKLIHHLQYTVSKTGVYTPRPAKDFNILLASIFGGAGIDTTDLWTNLLNGAVSHIDYIDGEIFYFNDGYNYLKEVDGLYDLINDLSEVVDDKVEFFSTGLGLMIKTQSDNNGGGELTITATYIDPTVFLQLGAFESVLIAADPKKNEPSKRVTGAATGIVNDIYKAFQTWGTAGFWLRKSVSGAVHGRNCLLRNSMLGWIGVNSKQNTMMSAKGVLSRVGRVGNYASVAGKIRTGIGHQYAPHIISKANGTTTKIPVAIFHPDCLLAKGLKHGDIVGVGRTPTVSMAFCVVRFSRTHATIGYICMSFLAWAEGNNGDTDGDPCNRILVGAYRKGEWRGVNYLRAAKMNEHALSMGGYTVVCGEKLRKWDCAEFVSFKDVWAKKSLNTDLIPTAIAEWAKEEGIKIKSLEALVNLMLPADLLDSAYKVSGHYRANVGIAYGWCSAYSAHMKEKHSYMEQVVTNLLKSELALSFGTKAPTIAEMMEVLTSGEIYTALAEPPTGADYTREESEVGIRAWYPQIMALCDFKVTPGNTTNPCDLIQMGQHIKVMLEASAWLWRGVYEGLGLSGYSPKAHAFFETFKIALRHKGMVADCSIKDENGKVILVQPGRLATQEDSSTDTTLGNMPAGTVNIAEFLSTHYDMNVDVANEIYAACLLYNGYRAIERGQHIPGDNKEQATTYNVYMDLYANTMMQWADTKADEFEQHAVLAGVFRRAGQGTTGVSIDEELSTETSAKMIYTYAQELWATKLAAPKPVVFFNPMLNDIVVKSVDLYTELVSIARDYYEQ